MGGWFEEKALGRIGLARKSQSARYYQPSRVRKSHLHTDMKSAAQYQ